MNYKSIIAGSMVIALGTTAFAHNSFKSEDVLSRGYYPHEFQQLVQESQKGDSVAHWEDVETVEAPLENDLAASLVKSTNKKGDLTRSWIDMGASYVIPGTKAGINYNALKYEDLHSSTIQVQKPVWTNQNDLIRHASEHSDLAYKLYKGQKSLSDKVALPILNDNNGIEGFVSYEEVNGEGVITVSYRGTITLSDLLFTDFNGFSTSANPYGIEGNIHLGFHKHYQGCEKSMNSAVTILMDLYGAKKILYTGHSLGAATATLGAVKAKQTYGSEVAIDLVTFSTPRGLNKEAADAANKLLPNALNVTRDGDVVPYVGIGIIGGKAVGNAINLSVESYTNPLANHSHKGNLRDACGDEGIEITINPIKPYEEPKETAPEAPKSFIQSALGFLGFGW